MSGGRTAGFIGGAIGLLAAGTAVGVATERYAIGRIRSGDDPAAAEPLDLQDADRSCVVVADDGIPLYVEEVGPDDAALTVVFVHGWALRMGSWHFQRRDLAALRDPALRLVFYDQRSHGRSGRAAAESATVEQLGDDLAAVLRNVGDDAPVVVVGHSLGGMSVIALAGRHPDLAARLAGSVLISTSAGGLGAVSLGLPGPIARLRPALLHLAAAGMRNQPALVRRAWHASRDVSWLITRRMSFGSSEVSPRIVAYVERMISSTPVDVIAEFMPIFAGFDERSSLAALRDVPILIVVGDQDRLTPPAHSAELARELPGAELLVVPGAGHIVILESPDVVDETLVAFLRRVPARTGRSRRSAST